MIVSGTNGNRQQLGTLKRIVGSGQRLAAVLFVAHRTGAIFPLKKRTKLEVKAIISRFH